jgi:hypothetical protein
MKLSRPLVALLSLACVAGCGRVLVGEFPVEQPGPDAAAADAGGATDAPVPPPDAAVVEVNSANQHVALAVIRPSGTGFSPTVLEGDISPDGTQFIIRESTLVAAAAPAGSPPYVLPALPTEVRFPRTEPRYPTNVTGQTVGGGAVVNNLYLSTYGEAVAQRGKTFTRLRGGFIEAAEDACVFRIRNNSIALWSRCDLPAASLTVATNYSSFATAPASRSDTMFVPGAGAAWVPFGAVVDADWGVAGGDLTVFAAGGAAYAKVLSNPIQTLRQNDFEESVSGVAILTAQSGSDRPIFVQTSDDAGQTYVTSYLRFRNSPLDVPVARVKVAESGAPTSALVVGRCMPDILECAMMVRYVALRAGIPAHWELVRLTNENIQDGGVGMRVSTLDTDPSALPLASELYNARPVLAVGSEAGSDIFAVRFDNVRSTVRDLATSYALERHGMYVYSTETGARVAYRKTN